MDGVILQEAKFSPPLPQRAVPARRVFAGRLALALIIVALGLRLYHYGRQPPMWHDEAAAVVNVLGKSFAEHWGPLYCANPSPPLFLHAEKIIVLFLGDGLYALRLLPFLASCAALLGMFLLGRRILDRASLAWLLLLFGCSDRLLWHSCEAKPYAVDMLVAVGVLLFVWEDNLGVLRRKCVLLAVVSPLLIFLSYPAVFVLGGLALAWLPQVWRRRDLRDGAALLVFLGSVAGAFLFFLLGPIRSQQVPDLLLCWDDEFPNWGHAWTVPGVMLRRMIEVFRYAYEPVGHVLSIFAVVGGVSLWRSGRQRFLAILLWPLALATLAWLAGKYPIGARRVVLFLAPMALLLIAAGIPPAMTWLRRQAKWAPLLAWAILLFPLGWAVYRVVDPWNRLDSTQLAAFVMENRDPDEPVVGTSWEHAYYFRGLEADYRFLRYSPVDPPTLPATFPTPAEKDRGALQARRLWLVARPSDFKDKPALDYLVPQGGWTVVREYPFRDFVVYHIERR